MQTPKRSLSNSSNAAEPLDAQNEQKSKKTNDEDDFDNDFDNEPLEDLDYDGVSRYDDEDDDF
jgi:hypothetical protein